LQKKRCCDQPHFKANATRHPFLNKDPGEKKGCPAEVQGKSIPEGLQIPAGDIYFSEKNCVGIVRVQLRGNVFTNFREN
jgi:hypothetical protein